MDQRSLDVYQTLPDMKKNVTQQNPSGLGPEVVCTGMMGRPSPTLIVIRVKDNRNIIKTTPPQHSIQTSPSFYQDPSGMYDTKQA